MKNIERIINPKSGYGPRFFRDEKGRVMFEHRISASACIGPREATKIDKQNHDDLWAEFLAQQTEAENAKLKRKR
jgi:hypothetical protein